MNAPTPFEVFRAGMFDGLINGRNGKRPGDYSEDDLRQAFRDWLEERDVPAGGCDRTAP